jgi:hypothetical protein
MTQTTPTPLTAAGVFLAVYFALCVFSLTALVAMFLWGLLKAFW